MRRWIRITSEDYTFITLRGELRTKSEILKGFKSGSLKYESRELSDLNFRVYGNTAIVTGRATQKGAEDEKDYSDGYRFTRVYIWQRDHWEQSPRRLHASLHSRRRRGIEPYLNICHETCTFL
jgi:hypothetical protein